MSYTDLYAELPALDCKGLCVHSCKSAEGITIPIPEYMDLKARVGPIPSRLSSFKGVPVASLVTDRKGRCPKLRAGRCTIYQDRPMICRLFGLSRRLACPHGCEPDRWLTDQEVESYIRRAGDGR